MKIKFNFTKNGKVIKTFETLQEAMDMLRRVAANDISNDILEVQKVKDNNVVSYYDLMGKL